MNAQTKRDGMVTYESVTIDEEAARLLEVETDACRMDMGKCLSAMIKRVRLDEATHKALLGNANASMPDELKRLWGRICHYESLYFPEMLFKDTSVVAEYIMDEQGEAMLPPYPLTNPLWESFRCLVEEMDDAEGQVKPRQRTLTIAPENVEDEDTILHEMIHAYEALLMSVSTSYHDILCLSLYKDLKGKLPDLDKYIREVSNPDAEQIISANGGSHSILFFLKSLDLDLRRKQPLGKICGYWLANPNNDGTTEADK